MATHLRPRKRKHATNEHQTTAEQNVSDVVAKKRKTQDHPDDHKHDGNMDIETNGLTQDQKQKVIQQLRLHHKRLKKCKNKRERLAEYDRFQSAKQRDKQQIPESLLPEWEQFFDKNLWVSHNLAAITRRENPKKTKTSRRVLKEEVQTLRRRCLLLEQQNAEMCRLLVKYMLPSDVKAINGFVSSQVASDGKTTPDAEVIPNAEEAIPADVASHDTLFVV